MGKESVRNYSSGLDVSYQIWKPGYISRKKCILWVYYSRWKWVK
jgi:hypothetical protein